MQMRSGKKTTETWSYHVNQVKVWIYFVFACVMDAFCIVATLYGNGSANGLAAILILFFSAAALVPLYLIYRRRVHRPVLKITGKGLSCPRVFSRKPVSVSFRDMTFVREIRLPAVVEVHYAARHGRNAKLVIWADMFRNKEQYRLAADRLMDVWRRIEARREAKD